MNTTAQILDKIESAPFEKLCGQVLRKMVPELVNLIPSGINSEGRTIRSLSDGFCFADRDHYVMVHVTTNASDLKTKWLYEGKAKTKPHGDLIKGIEQAMKMREDNQHFRFSVFLVSNKPVSEELHIKVNEKNTKDFITVRIIEQRDLVSFLDDDPEGQYLRWQYLGISANRISESLLKDIVKENLKRYGKEIYLEEAYLATLSVEKNVTERLGISSNCINLLTGSSGFGKSTLCFAIMHSVLEKERIAIRVKPVIIEKAVSLEDAILKQILNDYPNIFIQLQDISVFFREGLIIVDDINSSENATALLDKLISWNLPRKNGDVCVICPVWPRYLAALDNKTKKTEKYTVISLRALTFNDCVAIIRQRLINSPGSLTEQQMHSLIIDTGYDPLLLDFSLNIISDSQQYSGNIAREAIGRYVADKIQQVHHLYQYPVDSIRRSLILFARAMLVNRNLDPHLDNIREWLNAQSDYYTIITKVAAERQLIFFDDVGKCFFRHDRVRDHLLALAAAELIGDYALHAEVLADPYFAEIIGAAIAIGTVPKEIIGKLIDHNPLPVFISLKYLQEEEYKNQLSVTVDVIQGWNATIKTKHIPTSVTMAIANTLISFDVLPIEKVTQEWPNSAELQLAKFRNGIWLSGIQFFSFIDYFYPEAPTYWWNSILAHVKVKYLDQIIKELSASLLDKFTPEGIAHAYTLAGFLRDPRLLGPLSVSWQKYASSENYTAYIWAILNCFTKNDRAIVFDALSYWNDIPPEGKQRPNNKGLSAKAMAEQFKGLDWDFTDEQLNLLMELTQTHSLREVIAFFFSMIDHPLAFEIVLDHESKREDRHPWHENWDARWDRSKTKYRLSKTSLQYLQNEFSDPSLHDLRRYVAWRYWTGNVEETLVLKQLQGIVSETDYLFDDSVMWRIKHHDKTAFESVKKCIARKPWQVRVLDNIWSEDARIYFQDWFRQRIAERDIENIPFGIELLCLLDNEDASAILIDNWDNIKFHPKAIGAALFLSTPLTLDLAWKEARRLGFDPDKPMNEFYCLNLDGTYVSIGDEDVLSQEQKANLLLLGEQFKYLYMHYGNKYEGRSERLTKEKLENLLPYLPLLNESSIYQFAIDSLRIGLPDLCYNTFYPLLEGHLRRRLHLTAEELKWEIIGKYRELDRDGKVFISPWMEEIEKLGVTNEMLVEALLDFCNEFHNANAFFIISFILERFGTRKNISIMDSFTLDSEQDRSSVKYWKGNAIFSIKRRSLN